MPQLLDRIPVNRLLPRVRVIPGRGRELARVVAFNENHDELGRFASGDGGSSREDALAHLEKSANPKDRHAAKLTQKADRNPTTKNRLDAQRAHMAAIGSADPKSQAIHIAFLTEKTTENDRHPWKVGKDGSAREVKAFNENHDELGRFAESGSETGGGGGPSRPTGSPARSEQYAKTPRGKVDAARAKEDAARTATRDQEDAEFNERKDATLAGHEKEIAEIDGQLEAIETTRDELATAREDADAELQSTRDEEDEADADIDDERERVDGARP